MTVGEATKDVLLTLAPVTALVSGRIFMGRWPQSPTTPAILLTQIGDHGVDHLRGRATLTWARIQVSVLSPTLSDARAVDQAIVGGYSDGEPTGLLGANVVFGGSPSVRVTVDHTPMGTYQEFYEAGEVKKWLIHRDFKVWVEA